MSSTKKNDLPAMPFYWGDWRKAPEIRALDLEVRMIWFEMLGLMWESTERGYLTINGKPPSIDILARMLGIDITKLEQALYQMSNMEVYSVRDSDGAIYSRKMVHDADIREKRAGAGRKGMKNRYNSNKTQKPVITKALTNTENETEIEIEIEKKDSPVEKIESANFENYNPVRAAEIREGIYEVTRYLNSLTGATLDPQHPQYCSTIWRRINQGNTFEQLRAIIDTKVAEWGNSQKMRIHLNPITLFNEENFDRYLSQASLPPIAEHSHNTNFDQP